MKSCLSLDIFRPFFSKYLCQQPLYKPSDDNWKISMNFIYLFRVTEVPMVKVVVLVQLVSL